jgi:hypothetical protein
MKKTVVATFLIGLIIGILQLFWTYERTMQNVQTINTSNPLCLAISPECGSCMYEIKNGKCYEPANTQKFRGIPFSSGSYGFDSRIDTTPMMVVNVFIWAFGLPALVFILIKIKRKLHKA